MLKKPIKFKNLEGEEIEREFYFNLSEAELSEMQLSQTGGLQKYLERIIETENSREIVRLFKDIILMSIGQKHEDGVRFVKSDEIRDAFVQSDAYNVLFMEFFTNEEAGFKFITGIVPENMRSVVAAEISNAAAGRSQTLVELPQPELDEGEKLLAENRDLTSSEMGKLSQTQKLRAYEAKEKRQSAT